MFLADRMGWHWSLSFLQPGQHHSDQRKMLRRGIGPQRVGSHNDKIEKNTAELLMALQGFEGNPFSSLLRFVPVSIYLRAASLMRPDGVITFNCIARLGT